MMVQVTRDLVEILIQNLIVPSASSLGDVDGITQSLKRGIVTYILDCGDAPKDALAKIFDKSDRWIYRQLEEMDGKSERRHLGDDHAGYLLMAKIVEFYLQLYPKEAPAKACVHALRRAKLDVLVQTVEPILNLCVDQGFITRMTIEVGGHKETVYRAVSNGLPIGTPGDIKARKVRVAHRVRSIFPMLRAYIQGNPLGRCTLVSMGLPEDKIKVFLEKTHAYMESLARELQEEVDRDPNGRKMDLTDFRLLLLSGPGPFNDLPKDG